MARTQKRKHGKFSFVSRQHLMLITIRFSIKCAQECDKRVRISHKSWKRERVEYATPVESKVQTLHMDSHIWIPLKM